MRNLKLLSAQKCSVVAADSFCSDKANNVYLSTAEILYSFDKISKKVLSRGELLSENEDANSYVIGMEYLDDSIFIVTSSGELYLYSIDEKTITGVGFVETRVSAFAWSKDKEFLIIVTGGNTLILMTRDFDPITEKNLCPDEFGKSEPINVGWGSKTTQFHGSEGKRAAVVKEKEPKQALPYDDRKPRISWREDGEFFVTSTVDDNRGYRLLRIWSQEAVLQFTSQVVEGLEEPVSWRPKGNVIACSQQCPNKHKVIFFEKNGLQHGEFALPFKPNTFKVSTLSWNSDSSILLVVAEELGEKANDVNVMLWTSSNYYWYLKQKFVMKIPVPHRALVVKWSSSHPYELQCYNPVTAEFYQFKWTWSILLSTSNNDSDNSIVASIDNDNLLISTFGKLVVPPPLCAYMFSVDSSIEAMFFAPDRPAFGAYIGNLSIAIFQKESLFDIKESESCKIKLVAAGGNGFKPQIQPYSFMGFYNINVTSSSQSLFGLCHFTWVRNNKLLCVCYCAESHKYCILCIDLSSTFSSESKEVTGSVLCETENSVIGMCSNDDGAIVAVQLDNGRIFQLDFDGESKGLNPWLCDMDRELILPEPCSNMAIITIAEENYVLGLSEKFYLYCNNFIILQKCTSFAIHPEFLLTTAVDHLKCFTKKFDLPDALQRNSFLTANVQSQNVEKGARIIIAPAGSTKVILQMPRGNLETIHPRPLILSAICKCLDRLCFSEAFNLAKVHRIDLNILYDHNPTKFLSNIEKIIDQITSPSDLNLLLASLKNEDVCLSMYSLMFERNGHSNSMFSANKINEVCDAFRNVLESKNIQKYYQTLMATYAKKVPSELDRALILLKSLKDANDLRDTQNFIDNALSFLLYIVDVETLRLTALGTYDLETTVMVEQKSQRDPKEFLPFYNNLQELEENYRKYKIDMYLKRYKKALEHISKCGDRFDECLSLIKEQRLYSDAVRLFTPASDAYKVVWKEYGNYLMNKRYFDEAGLAFTRCEEHEQALSAYQESLDWKMALCIAAKMNYDNSQIACLCRDISRKLRSDQKYLDAAYLLEHYVKDPEESIVALIEGSEWKMAMLTISKYNRSDIGETHLKPALKEFQIFLKSSLQRHFETFSKHLERLKFLRTQKKVQAEQQANIPKFAEDDLFSDTGSVTDAASSCAGSKQMSGSIVTRKSSKSRRKQKLKKYRLREGSADEDLALIAALAETVSKIDSLKDNFLDTLIALIHYGYDDLAKEAQDSMSQITLTIETEIPIIWNSEKNNASSASQMLYGPDSTVNSITASLQQDSKTTNIASKDPELAAPPWRKMDLTLQILK